MLTIVIGTIHFNCSQPQDKNERTESNSSTVAPAVQQPSKKPDKNALVGNWERTDADYMLKISELADGGTMKAEYLNPKSIHVAKAMWAQTGDALNIYIELRDENYPGSYYKLAFLPGKDILSGTYFQAVESVTYDVEFSRKK